MPFIGDLSYLSALQDKVPAAKRRFMDELASKGGQKARDNDLPVSAMLACGACESGWGTKGVYPHTLNPFSLQKWPHILFPKTHATYWSSTEVQTHPSKFRRAPFNCAKDYADAARQWCEWILHYGEADGPPGNQDPKVRMTANAFAIGRREQLLKFRHDPVEFAKNIYLVGFGENAATSKRYAECLTENSMTDYD